jgi:hypothetical protein
MKNILYISLVMMGLLFLASCQLFESDTRSIYEFTNKPQISRAGTYTSTGLDVTKTITKAEILKELDIDPNAEIISCNITGASVSLVLDEAATDAKEIQYSLDYSGSFIGFSGTQAIDNSVLGQRQSLTLTPSSGEAMTAINALLSSVVKDGGSATFDLQGTVLPAGTKIKGSGYLNIQFDVTYRECLQDVWLLSKATKIEPCYR